ncbi:MAG: ribosome biogenesis GTPase Der [Pseudomonadota bacterium]
MATAVLIGRPNVGKSTLFNRLVRSRDALVADVPGLTRDRRYGRFQREDGTAATLIDTGGLFGDDSFAALLRTQVDLALDEADLVLFVVDARDGQVAADDDIVDLLRRRGLPVLLVVNKLDGLDPETAIAEFAGFGLPEVMGVAAAQGRGMAQLQQRLDALLPVTAAAEPPADPNAIQVALIGRPNVGKSTLTNRLLGEDRQLVFDGPGTTRDAIDIPLLRDDQPYVLIDTAGVRRKGKTEGVAEKFSVVKSLAAMERAQVVLLVIDAVEGLVEQDLHLLGYAVDAGCGIILCVNKIDDLPSGSRDQLGSVLDRRLRFAPWIPIRYISALHGSGVGRLWSLIRRVHAAGTIEAGTSTLTRLLEGMVLAHPPPSHQGRQIKLRYAHKAGDHPPTIVIHGNQTEALPESYVRYLEKCFREALKLDGNPIRLLLRTGDNPYAGKANKLNERQVRRRGRMIEHRKKTEKRKAKKRR